jgi:hypothetical protein
VNTDDTLKFDLTDADRELAQRIKREIERQRIELNRRELVRELILSDRLELAA